MHEKLPISVVSLAKAFGQSADCVKLINPEGQLLWMNPNGLCAMEIDDVDTVLGKTWLTMWPDDAQQPLAEALQMSAAGETTRYSGLCPTAKGENRWWDVTIHPLHNDSEEAVGFLSISRDVTEREQSRIALESTVSEMRHRLRNSYMLVCSLVSGLARGDEHLSSFSGDVRQRVMALAEAQTLFAEGDVAAPLDGLLHVIFAPFQSIEAVSVTIDVDGGIVIDRRTADAVALAIGEFAVNSAKHGAIAHGGSVALRAYINDAGLCLKWVEHSRAPVLATSRDGGQGFAIIHRMMAATQASVDFRWRDDGLDVDLIFTKGYAPQPT